MFGRSQLFKLLLITSFLLVTPQGFAQGGPPLVTDDPDTPGDGHWEINSSLKATPGLDSDNFQAPLLDINYGLNDNFQLNFSSALTTVMSRHDGETTGLSLATLGLKWRFADIETSGIAVSIYPKAEFHHPLASRNDSINPTADHYVLPIEFSQKFDKVGVNPEFGFSHSTESDSEWQYGLALSYSLEKDADILVEYHGSSLADFSENESLFNLGTHCSINKTWGLLASIGRTVKEYRDEPLSWSFFLGLQWRSH